MSLKFSIWTYENPEKTKITFSNKDYLALVVNGLDPLYAVSVFGFLPE